MAIYADFSIDQGSTFESSINVTGADGNPLPLDEYTPRGKVRKSYRSSTSYDFTCTNNADITGKIDISLSSSTTLSLKAGRYVYDIEIVNGTTGKITRVVEGQITITPSVTQDGA